MTLPLTAIQIDRLTKRFGSKVAVDRLTLSIPVGSLYCLLGRNGAGKTTTLRTILGLTTPTTGSVRTLADAGPTLFGSGRSRAMGYLPETSVLYDHLTGREFIEFIAALHGSGVSERIDQGLERVGMAGEADQRIRTYSLGMKRRVAFLAAILHEPEILVLDEPTGALDAVGARTVKGIMEEFRDRGRTVLFTTHLLELAERLADRFAILHEGRLRFEGTLGELRRAHGRASEESLETLFLRITQGHADDNAGALGDSTGAA